MTEEIYMDNIECPFCDRDTYIDSSEIVVEPSKKHRTKITCDACGGTFNVITYLSVDIEKIIYRLRK